jgi:hypothetical protein
MGVTLVRQKGLRLQFEPIGCQFLDPDGSVSALLLRTKILPHARDQMIARL